MYALYYRPQRDRFRGHNMYTTDRKNGGEPPFMRYTLWKHKQQREDHEQCAELRHRGRSLLCRRRHSRRRLTNKTTPFLYYYYYYYSEIPPFSVPTIYTMEISRILCFLNVFASIFFFFFIFLSHSAGSFYVFIFYFYCLRLLLANVYTYTGQFWLVPTYLPLPIRIRPVRFWRDQGSRTHASQKIIASEQKDGTRIGFPREHTHTHTRAHTRTQLMVYYKKKIMLKNRSAKVYSIEKIVTMSRLYVSALCTVRIPPSIHV